MDIMERGFWDGLSKEASGSFVAPALLGYYRGEDAPHRKKTSAALGVLLSGALRREEVPLRLRWHEKVLRTFTRRPASARRWRFSIPAAALGALIGIGGGEFGALAARGARYKEVEDAIRK
jgi:hypothetical protein